MKMKMPYFLENEEWYWEDEEGKPHLTDRATEKAVESFREFMEWMEEDDGMEEEGG